MKKIAVFPGSFDPITIGHESIVKRALPMFDKIIIAVGFNSSKEGFFTLKKRIEWIKHTFKDYPNISVDTYEGLTIDYCKKVDAKYILRGLRTSTDFEYERTIAQNNRLISDDKIESIFLLTSPELTAINSSIIREIFHHGGATSIFIPKGIVLEK